MMCLVLRLAAPMQSWGIQSRFSNRDTGREPSKSGVIGLLCAALGRGRDEPLDDLACLIMGVRIDRPGVYSRDFHTAGGGTLPGRSNYGVVKAKGLRGTTVVTDRFYLADAEFRVALAGEPAFLRQLEAALGQPRWPLFLGRKAFTPEPPLCLGIHEGGVPDVLAALPWWRRPQECEDQLPEKLLMVLECGAREGTGRMDVPLSFAFGRRSYTLRYARTESCTVFPIELSPLAPKEAVTCS